MVNKTSYFLFAVFLLLFSSSSLNSQNRLSFQFGAGVSLPLDQLKGDFTAPSFGGSYIGIDTNFIKNNYGANLGFGLNGAMKYRIDKFGYTRAVLSASFNSFYNNGSGYINENGFLFPARYNWNMNFVNIGAGFEVAPLAQAKVTPFLNANILFTIMSASMRAESSSLPDETSWLESFRMGVSGNAGFEIKTSKNVAVVIGGTYTIHNLLLKDNDNYNHANFGKKEIGFNDKGGYYFSNFYEGGYSKQYYANEKKLTSLTLYAGVSFTFDVNKNTPKKPTGK
jgi:hypothetical protein